MTASPGDSSERQAEWERAFSERTLPSFVKDRLNAAGDGRLPWLSTMTPAELMLSRSHGIRPVATVMGICALHYGYSWTRGHAEGWHQAIARLKWEAWAAHGNAVVDVKMRTLPLGGKANMDYALVGTAVQVDGLPPNRHPIVATASASEFVQLLQAGIVPSGIAIGAHYEFLRPNRNQTLKEGLSLDGGWSTNNQPLDTLSKFWQRVQRKAIPELQKDARQQGTGILAHTHFGDITEEPGLAHEQGRYLGRYIIMGTVIDTMAGDPVPQEIRTVVDMRDGASPLNGGSPPHNIYPVVSENASI